ncbi:hypothetical protein V2J94_39790 [Streptomyces sp. DSM 41524]|uniref:Uncharacterized protein n=1 Tax=Streptomyces asiaticus subsp. ignotus TaxID=3098222 RepID=A0ABU7Q975_9ACTN|nr:hypothetical protein [Streptomyces sp. DSM 41524]
MELPFGVKLLLLLAAALLSIIVGIVAGILARLNDARLPDCIARGGMAFGAAMTLLVLVLSSLGALA